MSDDDEDEFSDSAKEDQHQWGSFMQRRHDWVPVLPAELTRDFEDCLADGQRFDQGATVFAASAVESVLVAVLQQTCASLKSNPIRSHDVFDAFDMYPEVERVSKRLRKSFDGKDLTEVRTSNIHHDDGFMFPKVDIATATAERAQAVQEYLTNDKGKVNEAKVLELQAIMIADDEEDKGSGSAALDTNDDNDDTMDYFVPGKCVACDGLLGKRYAQLPCLHVLCTP